MKFGVVFPQTEFAADSLAIRDYAQTAEELGYNHILAYDHVLGANPDRPGGLHGPYTYAHTFQEPLVLFSFMAGFTTLLEFTTGIIILPQRQTALFAKQAATLDILSGGRIRLGLGIGWNTVEFTALGESFNNRGRRIEEQIDVLRMLWTQPLVKFTGQWHKIPDAGINPLPIQRPIPIWLGGHAPAVLERAARLADGWMPMFRTADDAIPSLEMLVQLIEKAGRDPAKFGIEVRISYGDANPDHWLPLIQAWQAAGATHLDINTMGAGLQTPKEHLTAIRHFAQAVGLKA